MALIGEMQYLKIGGNTYSIPSSTETDPVFSASAAAGITVTDTSNWNKIFGLWKVSSGNSGYDYWWTLSVPQNGLYNYTNAPGSRGALRYIDVPAYVDGTAVNVSLEMPTKSGRIALTSDIPTKTSDLTNDSGYITSYIETDPVFSASAAYSITSSDISNWNDIVSDDHKWNDVQLVKGASYNNNGDIYIPYMDAYNSTTAYTGKGSATPHQGYIAKYDVNAYLYSTTPSANDNSTKVATTAYVDSAIDALPEPMVFKGSVGTSGTVTSLPTAAATNEGWTYKVITSLSSPAAKVGDTVISNGSNWVVIPSGDEPSGTVTSIGVSNATNGGLTISGSPITSSGTITIGHSNVLSSAQTTQAVYPIKIDKNGHISSYGTAINLEEMKFFLVTLTLTDENSGVYESDKTAKQIYDAFNAGRVVLMYVDGSYVLLSSVYGDDNYYQANFSKSQALTGSFVLYEYIVVTDNNVTNVDSNHYETPVNNATLTIQKNGTTIKSFRANASSDVTANITVPTKISDLTNDSGYITSASLPDLSNYVQNHYSDSVNSYILPWTSEGAGYIQYRVSYSDNTESSTSIAYGVDTQRNSWIGLDADSLHFVGNIKLQTENDPNNSIYLTIPILSSDVTLTLPNTTGTLALTSNIPTKTSDLTNDSGFITSYTDEKLKTNTNYSTDGTEYSLIFGNNTTNAETKYYSEGLRFSEYHVDTIHNASLSLGKSNLKGILLLHDGTNNVNNSVQIYSDTLTQHQSIMLPNKSGTIALTSDIPPIPLIPTDLSDLNNDLNVSDFPNDAGYITGYTETDPVFTASAAYGISASDITNWNGKSNFSGNYNDLTNKPTIPVVPTNISAFTNDSGFITSSALPTNLSDLTNDCGFAKIHTSTAEPTSTDGADGDIWIQYE